MPLTSLDKSSQAWLKHAEKASALGREILLYYYGRLSRVKQKGRAGLVSEADLESERAIQRYFRKHTPELGFLGEEESHARGGRPRKLQSPLGRWIVDPLDGTTNYVHRFPFFCISIGLELQGELQLGLVHLPILNTTYTAIKGSGAFRDGVPIRVSETKRLQDSLLATGFNSQLPSALKRQVAIFKSLVGKVRGVRRAGSAAIDLCLVAEGVFDGFWESNLNPWDTAAGVVIVQEAGGRVANYRGGEFRIEDPNILATNAQLHSSLLKTIDSCRLPR